MDLIIASPSWFSANSDIPVETWKGLLIGTGCDVAFCLETLIDSGAGGRRNMTHEEMRGVIASGLHRGADAVYFFNLYLGPYLRWPREVHNRLLKDAGSCAALFAAPRRHPLTIIIPWALGEPSKQRSLPYTGTHGVFRIHIGPKPLAQQSALVELIATGHDQPLDVRLNGIPCPWKGRAKPRQVYDVPREALSDGDNLIEVSAEQEFRITWVEIAVR